MILGACSTPSEPAPSADADTVAPSTDVAAPEAKEAAQAPTDAAEAQEEPIPTPIAVAPIFVNTSDIVRTIHHPTDGKSVGKGIVATDEVLQKVVVLDVGPKMAALKLVSNPGEQPDGMNFIDCKYPGVEKEEGTSVQLALLGMGTPTVEEWHVYPSPPFEENACVPHEQSKATLEAAKAAMKAAGLNIDRKPAVQPVSPEGLTVNGHTYTIQSETATSAKSALYREVYGTESDEAIMEGVAQLEVHVDGVLRYQIRESFAMQMAGRMSINAIQAVETEQGVAFLLRHSFTSGRGNGNGFSMTPVLK